MSGYRNDTAENTVMAAFIKKKIIHTFKIEKSIKMSFEIILQHLSIRGITLS